MSLRQGLRPLRAACREGPRHTAVLRALKPTRLYSTAPPPRTSTRTNWPWPLGLSLAFIPGLYYWFNDPTPSLSPSTYTELPISATSKVSPRHALITVPVPPASMPLFDRPPSGGEEGEATVVIQHMFIRNPYIQIERPYTPINDPTSGELQMVVKRVKGGEVGRLVHSLKAGDNIGLRGPLTTLEISPAAYDRIIMISTGTGVAPFLQLLSKVAPSSPMASASTSTPNPTDAGPNYHLLHLLPAPGKDDWAVTSGVLPVLQDRLGDQLEVDRLPPGPISREAVSRAFADSSDASERVIVLVCLPPQLLRPLCGDMAPNLDQGPVTGVLAELGFGSDQVWKLE